MDNEINNTQDKKQSKAGIIILVIAILIVILIGTGIYSIYNKLTNMGKQIDLGVAYTQQDFIDVMSNANFQIDDYSTLCLECEYPTFSDPQDLEVNITGAQASAWLETVNENLTMASISNTQIRFSEDKAEISTILTYEGQTFPVYASGNIFKATDKSVGAEIYEVKAGGIAVPESIINVAKGQLLNLANSKLASLGDTLKIDTLEVTNTGLHFDGKFPTRAE